MIDTAILQVNNPETALSALTTEELIQQKRAQRLTEYQFAQAVGASPRKIAALRRQRRIQFRRDGWKVFYLPEDIDAYFETMKRPILLTNGRT
jgi:hypothetical protein